MSGRVRRYFLSFLSFLPWCIPQALPLALMLCAGGTFTSGSPGGLLTGITILALCGVGFAWMLAWMAARRRPLARAQDARGFHHRRYLDLAAAYPDIYRACADTLRVFCKADRVEEDPARGTLLGQTQPSIFSRGSEIGLWVEALGATYTRVQVLTRPVVPVNVSDFGANRGNLNRVVELLRARYTVVAEG